MVSDTLTGPDATPAPRSEVYDEAYWSGGAAEKQHVFMGGNRLPERMTSAPFTIGELGFGTGLTFLLAAHLAVEKATPLVFISYEKHPLEPAILADIHRTFPAELQPLSRALLAAYAPVAGWTSYDIWGVALHLFVGDAAEGLREHPCPVDAWFLDGFSPAHNPAMWTAEVLEMVGKHTKKGGTASTYSVARVVREHLTAAGFMVEKQRGFPPKEHMLVARKTA